VLNFLKDRLKARVFATAGISYNPFGVPYSLGKYLQKERDIVLIDIGAHEGKFTSCVDRMCGVKRGLLIEPQPLHAQRLREEYSESRFTVEEAALSDWQGTVDLSIRKTDSTTSMLPMLDRAPELAGIDTEPREVVTCEVSTLSEVARKANIQKADLIKIDVQGAELAALTGGREFVRDSRMVWVEVSFKPLYQQSCLFHEVYDFMSRQGHVLMELEPGYRAQSGELIQADALFMRGK